MDATIEHRHLQMQTIGVSVLIDIFIANENQLYTLIHKIVVFFQIFFLFHREN